MPFALAIGVKFDEFWHLNPHKFNIIVSGHMRKQKMLDEQMWAMGMYIQNAVSVSIDHALNGRKAQSKYIDKPMLSEMEDNQLTEEERYEKELQKALLAEEQWILNDKRRGLPVTTIE